MIVIVIVIVIDIVILNVMVILFFFVFFPEYCRFVAAQMITSINNQIAINSQQSVGLRCKVWTCKVSRCQGGKVSRWQGGKVGRAEANCRRRDLDFPRMDFSKVGIGHCKYKIYIQSPRFVWQALEGFWIMVDGVSL